jgi:hypothetical protein
MLPGCGVGSTPSEGAADSSVKPVLDASQTSPDASIMIEKSHDHYHVHAVDASHGHGHEAAAAAGHVHGHEHTD